MDQEKKIKTKNEEIKYTSMACHQEVTQFR